MRRVPNISNVTETEKDQLLLFLRMVNQWLRRERLK